MKCISCNRRIGFIRRWRRKFFHAKVWVNVGCMGLLKAEEDVYFCTTNCVSRYQLLHPEVKILN